MRSYNWFINEIIPKMKGYEIKYVNERGDLGELNGIQFDSEKKGGYIYFWSSGYIGLQLVDYEKGEEIISDILLKEADNSLDNFIKQLI
ncbi:MAG: hypothetical protein ACK41Z_14225 [Sediminibacterium sp.]